VGVVKHVLDRKVMPSMSRCLHDHFHGLKIHRNLSNVHKVMTLFAK